MHLATKVVHISPHNYTTINTNFIQQGQNQEEEKKWFQDWNKIMCTLWWHQNSRLCISKSTALSALLLFNIIRTAFECIISYLNMQVTPSKGKLIKHQHFGM